MIVNHAQFIEAIREKNLVRIVFYSNRDAAKVDRECVPLDYGPESGVKDSMDRYWIWDQSAAAAINPLGLAADQIIEVRILGRNFSPEKIPPGVRAWSVPRDWDNSSRLAKTTEPTAPTN